MNLLFAYDTLDFNEILFNFDTLVYSDILSYQDTLRHDEILYSPDIQKINFPVLLILSITHSDKL